MILKLYLGMRNLAKKCFKRNNRKILVFTDYLQVIEASEIAKMKAPPFNISHWKDKSDFKGYLESIQYLIEEYKTTGSIHDLDYNSFEDIEQLRKEKSILENFKYCFMGVGERIDVERSFIDGKYRVLSNGRHRMYVAKKYNLKLLVYVSQEVRRVDDL